VRKTPITVSCFETGERDPGVEEWRQPVEAGKGKEKIFPQSLQQ
jgi:hypothetical protein